MATPLSADRLVAALRAEGLRVVEHRSWRTHNRNHKGSWGPVHGVMIHHTVTEGTQQSVELCYNGHSSLPGPLCHGVIAKDGTVYLVGNGRTNHAGNGDDDVLRAVIDERDLPADNEANTDGNRHFYGFECINLGDGRDPWPDAQLDAIERAAAAICRAHGWSQRSVIGHLEWQPGKIDPRGFGMDWMRGLIRDRLAGETTTPAPPAPSEEDDVSAFDVWAYKGTGETADAYAYLRTTARNVAILTAKIDALTSVNTKLVDAVAKLAADLGDLDPAAIVTELRQAIESVEVRLDVPDEPPTT
jgi:hypothetical protein